MKDRGILMIDMVKENGFDVIRFIYHKPFDCFSLDLEEIFNQEETYLIFSVAKKSCKNIFNYIEGILDFYDFTDIETSVYLKKEIRKCLESKYNLKVRDYSYKYTYQNLLGIDKYRLKND